ncbi:MAG: TetR/AcrR family transcriptional regulator [Beijerinckiaceae bacterium]
MALRPAVPLKPATDVLILEIAANHIRRFGIERTTVTRIAEEAGMSHANVYRYYPSKAALIEEITADWLKPLETGLRAIADAPDPAFDKLERIIFAVHRTYRDKLETDPNIFALFVEATEKGAGVARKHRNRVELEIQRTLEEGAGGGVFEFKDQKAALALVCDALHKFIHPCALSLDGAVDRATLEDRAGLVATLVLAALAAGRT